MLETLRIRGSFDGRRFLAPQILRLMRRAPRLIECNFDHLRLRLDDINIASATVLPTLRQLKFEAGSSTTHTDILDLISFPALEALSLPIEVVNNSLLRCLKRSAPPLQELDVRLSYHSMDSILQEFLHVVPSLVRFKIRVLNTQSQVANLFASLADSPFFLPNLHHLDIDMYSIWSDIPDSYWRTLLDAISTRRIELHVSTRKAPSADILAACRKLVVDGTQISIRFEELDFIAA
ncbi:hypothetical protein K438DRAFT_457974 [Mycena galopus ATCC 62051]|nr:hypothetical protein K438DRAFT_457974 [Mycena galopus ATCC 62051]